MGRQTDGPQLPSGLLSWDLRQDAGRSWVSPEPRFAWCDGHTALNPQRRCGYHTTGSLPYPPQKKSIPSCTYNKSLQSNNSYLKPGITSKPWTDYYCISYGGTYCYRSINASSTSKGLDFSSGRVHKCFDNCFGILRSR